MSFKQVKYYQDIGDYSEAYKIARADWDANPNLKWPMNTIAWLLLKMMKLNARVYAKDAFVSRLNEFKALGIPEEDRKLWSAMVWPVRDIIGDSIRMQWFTPQFGDELFAAIKDIPFDKPSDSYSALMLAFLQLGGLWPALAEFIEWWGFENFTDFDYRQYPENGILVSSAEKILKAYVQSSFFIEKAPSASFFASLEILKAKSPVQYETINKLMKYDDNRKC